MKSSNLYKTKEGDTVKIEVSLGVDFLDCYWNVSYYKRGKRKRKFVELDNIDFLPDWENKVIETKENLYKGISESFPIKKA